MMITVLNNQSIVDLAIQYRGAASAAFEIAKANGKSLTDDLKTGELLEIPDTLYNVRDIANYYQGKRLLPATAVTDEFINNIINSGIGEMIIEQTFIVR